MTANDLTSRGGAEGRGTGASGSRGDSPRRVLAIAGSDSGGGAGIQADLKALASCGVHGMTAITAITAQNTVGVRSVHPVPPEVIVDQVRAVAEDIGVDAVKIGMLGSVATITAVEEALDLVGDVPVVLDPVMVAESGAVLLDEDARGALAGRLLPRAAIATPNLAEARVLAAEGSPGAAEEKAGEASTVEPGDEATEASRAEPGADDARALARAIRAMGPAAVIVTGGHRADPADVFFDGERMVSIAGERHAGGAAHGSGCTHSSAVAALLAQGAAPLEAARRAREVAAAAVRQGLRGLGEGSGPVDALGIARRAPTSALT